MLAVSSACILALSACGGGGGGGDDDGGGTNPPGGGGTTANRIVNPQVASVTGVVGQQTPVSITFSANTGNVTDLRITSTVPATLPAGWTSSATPGATMCATVTTGATCRLTLTYAPTAVTPSSTMTINYSYKDNTGATRTGSFNVTYQAQAQPAGPTYAYVTNRTENSIQKCTIVAGGALSDCSNTVTTGLSTPSSIKFANNTTAYVTNAGGPSVSVCQVGTAGALTCTNSGANAGTNGQGAAIPLSTPADIAFRNTTAYILNAGNNTVTKCTIGNNGALGSCTEAAALNATQGSIPLGIAISGTNAYIATQSGAILRCAIGQDENLTCAPTGNGTFSNPYGITVNGTRAYIVNESTEAAGYASTITTCTIADGGTLGGCGPALANSAALSRANRIVFRGNDAYITTRGNNSVMKCTVSTDAATAGTLTGCSSSNGGFPTATGIAIGQ